MLQAHLFSFDIVTILFGGGIVRSLMAAHFLELYPQPQPDSNPGHSMCPLAWSGLYNGLHSAPGR